MPDDNSENIAQLRQRAEDAARLENENLVLQRQLALRDSGYQAADPLVAHLMGTYTGDPTSQAIETFLSSLGVAKPDAEAPAAELEVVPTFDQAVATSRRTLSSDTQPPGAQTRVRTDPYEAALLNKQHGIAQGKDPDDLLQQGVACVMGAAAVGDERVLIRSGRTGYADPRSFG